LQIAAALVEAALAVGKSASVISSKADPSAFVCSDHGRKTYAEGLRSTSKHEVLIDRCRAWR